MANAEKTSSGSDIDEKKRKRKLSNRESARRSRLKKQRVMEETIHEISSLERRIKENSERCRAMKQKLDSVESENAVLLSEKTWLSRYVNDLENMMINTTSLTLTQSGGGGGHGDEQNANADITVGDCRRRPPWQLGCDALQPMASFKT